MDWKIRSYSLLLLMNERHPIAIASKPRQQPILTPLSLSLSICCCRRWWCSIFSLVSLDSFWLAISHKHFTFSFGSVPSFSTRSLPLLHNVPLIPSFQVNFIIPFLSCFFTLFLCIDRSNSPFCTFFFFRLYFSALSLFCRYLCTE